MTRIHHHLLGHATTGQQRADALADLPRATGPHFSDHSGAFQAEDIASSRRRRIVPGPLQQIGTVQSRSSHANANLAHIAGGGRPLTPFQLPFDALQCLHAASIVSETPA